MKNIAIVASRVVLCITIMAVLLIVLESCAGPMHGIGQDSVIRQGRVFVSTLRWDDIAAMRKPRAPVRDVVIIRINEHGRVVSYSGTAKNVLASSSDYVVLRVDHDTRSLLDTVRVYELANAFAEAGDTIFFMEGQMNRTSVTYTQITSQTTGGVKMQTDTEWDPGPRFPDPVTMLDPNPPGPVPIPDAGRPTYNIISNVTTISENLPYASFIILKNPALKHALQNIVAQYSRAPARLIYDEDLSFESDERHSVVAYDQFFTRNWYWVLPLNIGLLYLLYLATTQD